MKTEKDKKLQRERTLKKANKIMRKIDDTQEAIGIVNIIMASYGLNAEFLGR